MTAITRATGSFRPPGRPSRLFADGVVDVAMTADPLEHRGPFRHLSIACAGRKPD